MGYKKVGVLVRGKFVKPHRLKVVGYPYHIAVVFASSPICGLRLKGTAFYQIRRAVKACCRASSRMVGGVCRRDGPPARMRQPRPCPIAIGRAEPARGNRRAQLRISKPLRTEITSTTMASPAMKPEASGVL